MKIGIDISSIIYGTGVSKYTSSLVEALIDNFGSDRFLLFGGSLRQLKTLKNFGDKFDSKLEKILLPLPPKIQSFLFNQWHLPIETLTGPLDVFHSWDWYTPATHQTKLVTTIHDLSAIKPDGNTHPEIVAAHEKSLFWIKKEAQHIIAISESTKQDIMALMGINADRISVIYEALPKSSEIVPTLENIIQTKAKFHLQKPYFLMVASQEPRKNINRTIEAFAPFATDYDLVLVGKSGYDTINPAPYVIQTGYLASLELACLIRGSAGILYPSLSEGFGFPILEAFFHQVPVVTSAVSSMPEVAGEGASYCDPLKIDSISDAIKAVIQNRQSLIAKGTQQLKKFSWNKTAQQTMAVYESVTKN